MKNIPFHGILAVGDTQRQAADNYRRLALGQDVAAFRDEGGSLSFISNSSSAPNVMFNPKTGDVDVVRDDSIVSQVSFASESSDAEVYPYHAVCSDGCGKHVVYDSVSSVQFCPMCTCSLKAASESAEDGEGAEDEAMALLDGIDADDDAGDGEGDADLDLEGKEGEGDDEEETSESADDEEEDTDDLSDLELDEELDSDAESESETETEDDLEDDSDGEASESSAGDGIVVADSSRAGAIKMFLRESKTSLSSGTQVGVEYVVCSDKVECGAHIVHNTNSLSACPVCLSSVEEPDGDLEGELDLDAEETGSEEVDLSDLDLDSESADGEEDGEELDGDFDDGEDDDLDVSDDEDDTQTSESSEPIMKTAVSFSRAGAQARFLQINGLNASTSGDGEEAEIHAEYVVCSSGSCGAHIVAADRPEFCPVCASETEEPEEDEESTSGGADKAAEILGNLGAEGEETAGAEETTEAEADEETTDATADETAGAGADKGREAETEETASESTSGDGEGCDKETEGETASEEETTDASESTDIDALALVDDSQPDSAAKLDVSYSSNVAGASAWTAFYEGKPVAMARASDAGKNVDLFDKPAFGQAALSAARQVGVKNVLRDLGFKPLVHSVPVAASLSKMVEERVAAERASLSASSQQHAERFQAALATATIGINRGFFKGVSNPLKAALCSAMSDAGMRNPEALVDSVFSRHFEPFSKIAHAKAEEIMQRPPEVQESLASAVLDVCYQSESSAKAGADLESKLSSIGVSVSSDAGATQNNNKQQPVAIAGQQVSTSSSFDDDLSLAIGTLGAARR